MAEKGDDVLRRVDLKASSFFYGEVYLPDSKSLQDVKGVKMPSDRRRCIDA